MYRVLRIPGPIGILPLWVILQILLVNLTIVGANVGETCALGNSATEPQDMDALFNEYMCNLDSLVEEEYIEPHKNDYEARDTCDTGPKVLGGSTDTRKRTMQSTTQNSPLPKKARRRPGDTEGMSTLNMDPVAHSLIQKCKQDNAAAPPLLPPKPLTAEKARLGIYVLECALKRAQLSPQPTAPFRLFQSRELVTQIQKAQEMGFSLGLLFRKKNDPTIHFSTLYILGRGNREECGQFANYLQEEYMWARLTILNSLFHPLQLVELFTAHLKFWEHMHAHLLHHHLRPPSSQFHVPYFLSPAKAKRAAEKELLQICAERPPQITDASSVSHQLRVGLLMYNLKVVMELPIQQPNEPVIKKSWYLTDTVNQATLKLSVVKAVRANNIIGVLHYPSGGGPVLEFVFTPQLDGPAACTRLWKSFTERTLPVAVYFQGKGGDQKVIDDISWALQRRKVTVEPILPL
ncbi:hypothetical protein IWQ62_004628 [Dispira parvispora]|uniref:Uncharacterized protein n=1 Tax=Dispira parvispora TaxID=1520584 RepID=A0A9W8E0G1_9FUNG|nr:hypothetical protein IWQ62_004628 [Dispira parvispora]